MIETILVVGSVLLSAVCFLGMASLFKEVSRIERLISDTMVRHEDNLHEINGIVSKLEQPK